MNFRFTKRKSHYSSVLLKLIMRTFIFLCCALTFAFSTNKGFSQDADIIIDNDQTISVKKIFKLINKQADYKFVYRHDLMKNAPKLFLKKGVIKASVLLEKCLSPNNFIYEFTNNNTIVVKKKVLPVNDKLEKKVQFQVKGIVTDDKGVPLPGASIIEKGTTNGTSTDFDGAYTLNVLDENASLVISYIGYITKEIPVQGNTELNIQLEEDAAQLNEVVVIGYGTQRKIDVTGSVSAISTEDLNRAPAANLSNSLSGRLTGVISTQLSGQPGFDNPIFSIRGESTFGNNQPLILVDGIVRSFSRVNPNEIESVTVLKDAASTAVYGARAANGVILITTKRGADSGVSFDYSSSVSFETPTIRPEFMNSAEYAQYYNEGQINGGGTAQFTDAEIEAFRNGSAPNTDWWAETVKKQAITQRHDLSASGGNENTKYFLSFGYLDQGGLLESSSFNSYNIRSNIDTKLTDNLSLSIDLAARKEIIRQTARAGGAQAAFVSIDQSAPTFAPYYILENGTRVLGFNGVNGSPIGRANFSGTDKRTNNIFQSSFDLTYKFSKIEGLSASARYAYDYTAGARKNFQLPHDYYLSATTPPESSLGNIILDEFRTNYNQETKQFRLNYINAWGDHNISALALVEEIEVNRDNIRASRDGFISSSIDQLFAGSTSNINNNGSASVTSRRGYVGRVNYNFADKYLFQVNARYDGSFNFPSNKRWGFFPAFSAGWVISNERFMESLSFIDNLKLRGSWGQVGNDRVAQYQFLSAFEFNGGYVVGGSFQSGINDSSPANPNITWETATTTNLGFEFRLAKGKFFGEFDYFMKTTEDILLPNEAATPDTFGSTLPDENFGIVDNKGFEFLIGHKNNIGDDFSYSLSFNGTYSKSKVIEIREPAGVNDEIKRTGKPLYQVFGYVAEGLFQTQSEVDAWADQDGNSNASLQPGDIKYRDLNDDGVINGDDRTHIGKSVIPEFVYGFNFGASYKGFDLNVFFQGASGFQRKISPIPFELDSNSERVLVDSWSPTNTGAAYPRLSIGANSNNHNPESSFWLKDASYLRLKNVELAYSLSQDVINKLGVGITGLRIYASGSNLLTFSKIDGRDPEGAASRTRTGNGTLAEGNRASFYPQTKSILFGINVKF